MSTIADNKPSSANNLKRAAVPVFVASTVMLTFISVWRVVAIVLSDLASSAYYVGGDAEKVIGKSAPWFILAVMLFSYAVRAVYIESSSMFVRGGVYRVVKEAMGGTLAKLSVSALLFDYILTAPISAVSAGQYIAGWLRHVAIYFHHPISDKFNDNYFSAAFAAAIVIYFWWQNTKGIHESSEKALKIMRITTVMVVILIVWCIATIAHNGAHLPPLPTKAILTGPGGLTGHGQDALGWLNGTIFSGITGILLMVGFGHSVLAMSGEETLAQVNREIEHPKLKNLQRAGMAIFVYSLIFTAGVSFLAVMIIPDQVRPDYFANLIGGLAMYVLGPTWLKLIFNAFVVLVGALILSGAANTAIVGANGVLNRISEDGVLTPWFQRPHKRYGTSYRIVNVIVILQLFTIIVTRGNVYFLAALYAFGVIWSFSFNALAVLVLRYKHREKREWKVPGNFAIAGREIPIGLTLITIALFSIAFVNLFTKRDATIAGVIFSAILFVVFTFSERRTLKMREQGGEHYDQFRVFGNPELNNSTIGARPGNILVAVRDPRNLSYLREALHRTDTTKQDVVVMTSRISHREHSFSGNAQFEAKDVFDTYEQELFTRVIAVAEKEGKTIKLLVVPGANVFDTIMATAQRIESVRIICGLSNKLTADEQGKLTGDAWESLPDPKPRCVLEVHGPDGSVHEYFLGPHAPRLRDQDNDLLHRLWLKLTADPRYRGLHHYDIIHLALREFEQDLESGKRDQLIAMLNEELDKRSRFRQ
jgi:amino acid transporter